MLSGRTLENVILIEESIQKINKNLEPSIEVEIPQCVCEDNSCC